MVWSDSYTVENAGVVNVRVNNKSTQIPEWKEGQVVVKAKLSDGTTAWKEAEVVLIKTADGWKESQ